MGNKIEKLVPTKNIDKSSEIKLINSKINKQMNTKE
jgi:hypothetical protein